MKSDFTSTKGDRSKLANDPSGNIITLSDSTLAKYNLSGNIVWTKNLKNLRINAIDCDLNGNIFLGGWFTNTVVIDSQTLTAKGNVDLFLFKLDQTGNILWKLNTGNQKAEYVTDLSVDLNGDVVIIGDFHDSLAIGNIKMVGPPISPFVSKLSSNGNVLWARCSKAGFAVARAIKTDSIGDCYFFGSSNDSVVFENVKLKGWYPFFFAKYSSNGSFIFLKNLGANLYVPLEQIMSKDKRGSFYLQWLGLESYAYLRKFDKNGNELAKLYPIKQEQNPNLITINSIAVSNDNFLFVAGDFDKIATICGSKKTQKGFYVTKFFSDTVCVSSEISHDFIPGADITLGASPDLFVAGFFNDSLSLSTCSLSAIDGKKNFSLTRLNSLIMSLNENDHNIQFNIYPNPATDSFTVKVVTPDNDCAVNIYNITGRLIESRIIDFTKDETMVFRIKTSGLYFVSLDIDHKRFTKKVIVQ